MESGPSLHLMAYGVGTLWFKDSEGDIDDRTVEAIQAAIGAGFRHFDGAQMYNTEAEVGLAIERSGVPRSEITLTTKVVHLDDVEARLEDSLVRLRTDYVDNYLIHSPFSANSSTSALQNAWLGMERCVQRGLARHIGLANFAIQHLEPILEIATIRPALNQIEMHPYLQQPDLLAYLSRNDIRAQGFASLTPLTKASPGPVDDVCKHLSEKYGVSQSAILLRWVIDQGASVVTTSGNKNRLQGYLDESIN
ncbi:hypothetical protein SAPIO_CDS0339 [Scedosporium apiospermum]|uniref:NADP-dependent oxidoreductase domain-containing protein n=1 Tax=Pseudallescheria apiosperma TaxID=563466 RepID=A0A084GGT3_PSEDA|nr:uncharacterized protein SAPIO_CDS0339 [Scedosporium apiospermum]KEZ46545.1 hypothetical protein SAPIO_CDS0339 [Scedosporium apiospermum]